MLLIDKLPTSTKSLVKYLKKYNLFLKKKWGQNFLLDQTFHQQIVKISELKKTDVVLEIGPGLGHLTKWIYSHVHLVLAVDVDPGLVPVLQQHFAGCSKVRAELLDILSKKHQINPKLWDIFAELKIQEYKILANLPYNISAPVIVNFLSLPNPPNLMVVTVQKEIAQRLAAKAGTEQYGPLSVMAQLFSTVEVIREIPPHAFFPKPKVYSSIVKIVPKAPEPGKIKDINLLQNLVKAIFNLRRKNMANALRHNPFVKIRTEDLPQILGEIDANRRGETLSLDEFIELSNRFADFLV